jgi:branched-chain amino acid aminotransferase
MSNLHKHVTPSSRALTWIEGNWVEGNPAIMGPLTHGAWMSTVVFDGARSIRGQAPDLDRHCARVIESAAALGLKCPLDAAAIERIAREGIAKFPPDAELYIRPLVFAETGFVAPDPASTRFVLSVIEAPMPAADGFSACISSRRRPSPEMAPTIAKASCLYPNVQLALGEAKARGFDSAVMLDPLGHVAEFATSNLFFAKQGVVHTPAANGTFLNGITRQRVIGLLRDAGIAVEERSIAPKELLAADEVFSTGNYAKVMPTTRIEDRHFQPGPFFARARELYFAFAAAAKSSPASARRTSAKVSLTP